MDKQRKNADKSSRKIIRDKHEDDEKRVMNYRGQKSGFMKQEATIKHEGNGEEGESAAETERTHNVAVVLMCR